MPEIVISADTTDTVKRRLDKFWQHQDILYHYKVEVIGVGNRSQLNAELAELAHIEAWAMANNLQLNRAKTKEIVFRSHRKRGKDAQLPAPLHDID